MLDSYLKVCYRILILNFKVSWVVIFCWVSFCSNIFNNIVNIDQTQVAAISSSETVSKYT